MDQVLIASGAGADSGFALALTVLVALIYLFLVRLLDLNEKEPLWGLALAMTAGGVMAGLLPIFVDSGVQLDAFGSSLSESIAVFAALLVVMAIFNGIAGLRGWSEVNGLMDGVVYGVTAGLGFATGQVFIHQLTVASSSAAIAGGSNLTVLWSTLLFGLRHGLFGGIIGAGFGLAAAARSRGQRILAPLGALVGAIIVHAVYFLMTHGSAAGGQGKLLNTLAYVIPLGIVVVLVVVSLGKEKTAITEELEGETASGVITADDMALLNSQSQRRSRYLQHLFRGDLDGWQQLRTLHNRQVQLALAKRRVATETDPDRKARAAAEVDQLRRAVIAARSSVPSTGAVAGEGGA